MKNSVFVVEFYNVLTPNRAILFDTKIYSNYTDAVKCFNKEIENLKSFNIKFSDYNVGKLFCVNWYFTNELSIIELREVEVL